MSATPPSPASLRASLGPLWEDGGRFRLVVLFGSLARGMGGPGSDLDLAFLPEGELDATALTSEIISLTHWNEVDVLDLRHADPMTAMEVSRHGIVLFARDASEFTEFRSLAFRRYVDTEKLRRAQRKALDRFEERR